MKQIWPSDGDIRLMLSLLPASAFVDALAFHTAVYRYLTEQGWNCSCENYVPDRGDGRPGRVDIVVSVNAGNLGIELDNLSPRKKSLYKLGYFCGGGFVLMRGNRKFVRVPPRRVRRE